ncbi:dynein regulatory complex protein 8-like [Stegodyphus dumicola]|uniref:dynein regulatory complex protein 8-like n=1 Tax=Stegodyphus dumicola TaxID=202533 RepID=UPI0015A96B39|nr:dynein regulatory complex protein 8-like [Stegodyphus dumicola]
MYSFSILLVILLGLSTYEINTQKQIIEAFRIFDQTRQITQLEGILGRMQLRSPCGSQSKSYIKVEFSSEILLRGRMTFVCTLAIFMFEYKCILIRSFFRNIEIIVRALGRVPRKAEIRNFIKEVEERDSKGFVKLQTLLPALTDILLKDKWKPAPKERLLQAFQFFDIKESGCIDPDHMKMLLTEHGDKLDEKEAESFLTLAIDPFKEKIDYTKCYRKFAVPEVVDILEDKKKIMKEIQDKLPQK